MSKNREEFLNPYYFISLPNKKTVVRNSEEERFTGKITYLLTTKTPLFIPNSSCDKAFAVKIAEHKSYDFYSYSELKDGEADESVKEPIIPGSEIRGMIRSVYEAVTGSCMSAVNDSALITERMGPREVLKPGLLKREEKNIYLVPAGAVYLPKQQVRNFQDGQVLYFGEPEEKDRREFVKGGFSKESSRFHNRSGFLLKGEIEPKGTERTMKKYSAIFYEKKASGKPEDKIPYREELKTNMNEILEAYEQDSASYIEYKKSYENFLAGKGEMYFPVYYGEISGISCISPAAITKRTFKNKVSDLLGKEFAACNSQTSLCPACDLFGMVNEEAKASKIRFADARISMEKWKPEALYMKKITLQELAEPKIANAQMYLKRPAGATEWSYDYWIDSKGVRHNEKAQINGRKFYWHHVNPELYQAEENERNVTVRPLKEEIVFQGDLYFEQITRKQLQQLIYLCDISREGQQGYKLGMGKPLGLGSVAMVVRNVTLRKFDWTSEQLYVEDEIDFANESERNQYKVSYHAENESESADFLTENHIQRQFELLTDFETTKGHTVSYPYTEAQINDMVMKEGFRWFVENKKKRYSKQYLKSEDYGELPFLKVKSNEKNDQKGNFQKRGGSSYARNRH